MGDKKIWQNVIFLFKTRTTERDAQALLMKKKIK